MVAAKTRNKSVLFFTSHGLDIFLLMFGFLRTISVFLAPDFHYSVVIFLPVLIKM